MKKITKTKTLGQLEQDVELGVASSNEALLKIYETGKFKEVADSWESYLSARWGISRQLGYRRIEAAQVQRRVSKIFDTPCTESHLIELSKAPEKEQAKIAAQVQEACDDENRKPTAKDYRSAVKPFLPKPPKSTDSDKPKESPQVADSSPPVEVDPCHKCGKVATEDNWVGQFAGGKATCEKCHKSSKSISVKSMETYGVSLIGTNSKKSKPRAFVDNTKTIDLGLCPVDGVPVEGIWPPIEDDQPAESLVDGGWLDVVTVTKWIKAHATEADAETIRMLLDAKFPPVAEPTIEAALADWTQYRKELRKPLTKTGVAKLRKRLEAMPTGKAIELIEYSISQGWQGLFEPEAGKNGKASGPVTFSQQKTKNTMDSHQQFAAISEQRRIENAK